MTPADRESHPDSDFAKASDYFAQGAYADSLAVILDLGRRYPNNKTLTKAHVKCLIKLGRERECEDLLRAMEKQFGADSVRDLNREFVQGREQTLSAQVAKATGMDALQKLQQLESELAPHQAPAARLMSRAKRLIASEKRTAPKKRRESWALVEVLSSYVQTSTIPNHSTTTTQTTHYKLVAIHTLELAKPPYIRYLATILLGEAVVNALIFGIATAWEWLASDFVNGTGHGLHAITHVLFTIGVVVYVVSTIPPERKKKAKLEIEERFPGRFPWWNQARRNYEIGGSNKVYDIMPASDWKALRK